MLRTLVLTGDNDTCWQVCDAHGRIRRVDMLSARTRRTISIDAQILLIYLDFDVFVNLRTDEQGSKGRVTARRLIKWRDANQTVHSGFGREQTVRVFAFYYEG